MDNQAEKEIFDIKEVYHKIFPLAIGDKVRLKQDISFLFPMGTHRKDMEETFLEKGTIGRIIDKMGNLIVTISVKGKPYIMEMNKVERI